MNLPARLWTLVVVLSLAAPALAAQDSPGEKQALALINKLRGSYKIEGEGADRRVLVDLRFTAVTDADLARLRPLKDLVTLRLFNTAITDAGLAHLAEFKRLRALSLNDTRVTDARLARLKGLSALRELGLR